MKTTGLNFIEAVKAAKEGKKIRRKYWLTHVYIYDANGEYIQHNKRQYNFGFGDYVDEDWEIVPDPPKTMGFMEAMAKVKAGHGVSRNCWSNRFVRNGTFTIVVVENASRYAGNYVPTHDDIDATDWVVVED